MMQNIKSKREEGFTIIEVLIVLAIAGLIMVVVFLAVPALQRNSRNNSRQTEARNLVSAISEVSANNGGTFSSADDVTAAKSNTKLSFYQASNVTSVSSVPSGTGNVNNVNILPGFKCGDTPTADPSSQNRSTVVLYWVETGGGTPTRQCLATS